MNGEVMIVDEHTGRILVGRRYNEGIHQAIEAKEGVRGQGREPDPRHGHAAELLPPVRRSSSGMTGTAETEAAEFMSTYKLGVVPIPTNKPMIRKDQSDLVYKNEQAKFDAGRRRHRRAPRRPASRCWSARRASRRASTSRGCSPRRASSTRSSTPRTTRVRPRSSPTPGRLGAVTVATNMAGRGTDIMLGGNAEFLAVQEMNARGTRPGRDARGVRGRVGCRVPGHKDDASRRRPTKVVEAGGLYVLGTERHESRRIDNQLRGRSGRQGDPGESRFYLSLHRRPHAPVPVGRGRGDPRPHELPRRRRRSSRRWSAAPSRARSRRSRRATPRSARTSSSTTTS